MNRSNGDCSHGNPAIDGGREWKREERKKNDTIIHQKSSLMYLHTTSVEHTMHSGFYAWCTHSVELLVAWMPMTHGFPFHFLQNPLSVIPKSSKNDMIIDILLHSDKNNDSDDDDNSTTDNSTDKNEQMLMSRSRNAPEPILQYVQSNSLY